MRIHTALGILAAGMALAACNEALVPDFNVPTGFAHDVGALQSEMTGVFTHSRVNMVTFNQATEGFARNLAYFTPSEVRFVTEFTGSAQLDIDNFGAAVWEEQYQTIKDADSVIGALPTLTNAGAAIPAANVKALQGSMETIKALAYMYILLSHDTVGMAINTVGGPISGSGIAPIVCARDGWRAIVAMLDTAQAELTAGPPSTVLGVPGSTFPALQVPPTYSAIGNTAGGWLNLVYALRGRARVEYAYAIARGPGGTRPTPASAGQPDVNQLDSAIIDITASNLYTPTLTAGEAIAANDLGVFHDYSAAAGDLQNIIYTISSADFVLEGAAQQIDTLHDQRFLAKFAPARPTSTGGSIASSYAYLNNISASTPIPITRNIQLQFLLARAYLGIGSYAQAASIVDNVRTVVGGLPTALPLAATDYVHVRDFLMKEMIPSLMNDATGDQIAGIRDYGLIMQDLTTWEGTTAGDFHTSQENIPEPERTQRNNNFAPVCP